MASSKASVPVWVAQLESPPPARNKLPGASDPLGFSSGSSSSKKKDGKPQPPKAPTTDEMETLKLKKAWEVALAPVKSLPMTAIMMYMSGNSLQIFSIMMVFMAFKNPLVGLMNTNLAFERFQTEGGNSSNKMLQTKLVYVAMQLVALAVGIWKVNAMGLLPTTRSDWLMWESQRESLDWAVTAL
uniref:ER membrane protein complex subunit 4 n=1 Tax=Tolypocladium ophioglossoides (strain CBS 100239) TaxID=1163406 RepID=A0A0L0NFS8_TOLOC|nr:ER membrane protein complex subunit 4 [Tolypocladium ophioglossoides CBS 100239]